jgi:hypothetical protein
VLEHPWEHLATESRKDAAGEQLDIPLEPLGLKVVVRLGIGFVVGVLDSKDVEVRLWEIERVGRRLAARIEAFNRLVSCRLRARGRRPDDVAVPVRDRDLRIPDRRERLAARRANLHGEDRARDLDRVRPS